MFGQTRTATVGGWLISAVVHAGLLAAATVTGPGEGSGRTPLPADPPELRARKGRATTLVIMMPSPAPTEQVERPEPAPPQRLPAHEPPPRIPAVPEEVTARTPRPVEGGTQPVPRAAPAPVRLPRRPAEVGL
ncbi:MAG: hypothetical protein ACLFV7_05965, partial [Phycisphaerae bacterium]